MKSELMDSTKVKLCKMVFMEVIADAMADKGEVDWESVEIVTEDSPDLGDALYLFKEKNTNQAYRIFFKRSSVGKRGFQYELFIQIGKLNWDKIEVDFKALN